MEETLNDPAPLKDGATLHFLKELPAWCVIGIFVAMFLVVWQLSHDDFIPRIIDALIGALLTAIVSSRPKAPTVTADTINTGDVLSEKKEGEN